MGRQVFAAVGELVTDEADAVKVGSHGEFLIFGLWLFRRSAFLGECLMIEREGKNNVTADFSGMKLRVKPPQFDRVVAGKKTVQVEKMVAAMVVVPVAAFAVALVPEVLDFPHCFRFAAVQLFHQKGIHLFAVGHSLRCNLQCFVKKVVLAGDDIDKIADAARRVLTAIEMNVNAAGFVCEPARAAKLANQFLQGGDILAVGKDGTDQLHAVSFARRNLPASLVALAVDAAVAHEFPNPTCLVRNPFGVVPVTGTLDCSAEVFRRDPRCLASGNAGKLNFNPKFCSQHFVLPLSKWCMFAFRMSIYHSKRLRYQVNSGRKSTQR